MDIDFFVRVSCMTYNQAPYIEDTMNGFCMQKTTFPFVCTIMDDSSTDGEQDVIRNYLKEHFDIDNKAIACNEETEDYIMIFAQHRTNKNCYFAAIFLKYNHYRINKSKVPYLQNWQEKVKYIALCEGDDYWVNPLKLEKQVRFLEENEEYGLVHSNFKIVNGCGNEISKIEEQNEILKEYEGNAIEKILIQLNIKTLTFCIRSKYWPNEKTPNNIFRGDKFIALNVALKSKIHYMEDVTGVYRSLPKSASHYSNYLAEDAFKRSLKRLDDYYMEKIPSLSKKTRMLIRYKWGVYEMVFKIANNDFTVNEIPSLLPTLPYIKIGSYKFVFVYILSHIRVFFYIFHKILTQNCYYREQ